MASPTPFLLSLFTLSLFFSTFPLVFTHTFSSLDVSAALQQAQSVISFDPQSHEQETQISQTHFNSSSLSLDLHPRSSLRQTHHHQDYKSLVLSRLDRDSVRVDSLTTKLELAINGVSNSEFQPQALSTPIVSGASQGSGEYFSRIGIGTPPKPFYMVLDTGSDINWLQCRPCTDCYEQSDPIFNPALSSSYKSLSCQSQQCRSLQVSACRNAKCLYQVSYGDGSYTVGDLATETMSFGNSGKINDVALGCGHDNEGLFTGAAGLIGLGGGPLSLASQIKATSFSYCLVDRDSLRSSTLDFNSVQLGRDSVTAPIIRNSKIDTFYYVGITGMSVGGQPVSIPPSVFQMDSSGKGGTIVDCGTAITRLQTQAYNPFRDSFVKLTQHLKPTKGVALFDTCYDLSSAETVKVPTVAFSLGGGKSLSLPAKNYLIPVDSVGTFCLAFAPTTSSLSIIGNVQQQGTRVTFDLANSVIGFSPNKC